MLRTSVRIIEKLHIESIRDEIIVSLSSDIKQNLKRKDDKTIRISVLNLN